MQREVKRTELKMGDVIKAKGESRGLYKIVEIRAGISGRAFPFLVLERDRKIVNHDTAWDSLSATYTVVARSKKGKGKR